MPAIVNLMVGKMDDHRGITPHLLLSPFDVQRQNYLSTMGIHPDSEVL
jgi:hypothetical protein